MAKDPELREEMREFFLNNSVGTIVTTLKENIKADPDFQQLYALLKKHSKKILVIISAALVIGSTASEQVSYLRSMAKYNLKPESQVDDYSYDTAEIVRDGIKFGHIIQDEWIAHSQKGEDYDVNDAVLSYLGIESDRIVNTMFYSRIMLRDFDAGVDSILGNEEWRMNWLNLAYTSIIKGLNSEVIAPNIPDNVQEFLRFNGFYEKNYEYSFLHNELSSKTNHGGKSKTALADDVIDYGIANRNRRMKIYKASCKVIGDHDYSLSTDEAGQIKYYNTTYNEDGTVRETSLCGFLDNKNVFDYSTMISRENGGLIK